MSELNAYIKISVVANGVEVAAITDAMTVKKILQLLQEGVWRQGKPAEQLAAYDRECAREDRDGK